ncbi:bifunctional 2',3'-cyclic-nucleotide 2'-phosphodiesterase/3'-nucleotidase [Bacillus testis]|uniref:bifunctional 2',3'-cyclic-nucleotide 2'-phosphodiesterase/3'-nucleotidase n=1 Tax=Bacillus testis TaxID=1622072 RepID=UPI00067E7485|nr:bifunctional 2',3'-cyclic-nucleotide 2'-phosphodiesterase/3'-nucleotidase [Bacillus testis]
MNAKKKAIVSAAVALGIVIPQAAPSITYADVMKPQTVKLRIMETTDTHTNLLPYDYYKGEANDKVGLTKTATLVKEARAEVKNTVLVDNGDTIQGTPLGNYFSKIKPVKKGEVHPVIKVMNGMKYDMANLGNHEFNFGLDYLEEVYNDATFPHVNANVYVDDKDDNPDNDKNVFTPYQIVEKKVTDENGKEATLKIGYLGLVAPQITNWDKANLEGKAISKDIVATAQKFVPQMKAEGADIVIAMAHSGFNAAAEANNMDEDAVLPLSKVEGIDAITFSHTHQIFPTGDEKSLNSIFKDKEGKTDPSLDNVKGTINGVPAVQAGVAGEKLGLIDLTLQQVDGKWKVVDSKSSTKQIYDNAAKKPVAEVDSALAESIKADSDEVIAYTNGKLGTTTAPIHSYFGLVQDDPSIQVVTAAQKWYAEKHIQSFAPQYKDTPILSVGAPFKAGRNGVEEYTEIQKGDITIRSAGDLYLYDNTLKAILVKGSTVKEWLEMSAGKFNTIDPAKTEEQPLLNPSFYVFNFDVIDGVTYQVDVTKPAKYKPDGKINDANSSRIVHLQYNGKAIDPDQDFIVVTNNYRATGGGNFPGVNGSKIIIDSADENRQILMDYIAEKGEINPSADNNWSIAPIKEPVNVTFTTSPKAETYAKETNNISYTGQTDDKGFGIFKLDLSKAAETTPAPEPTPTPVPEPALTFTDVPAGYWAKPYIDQLVSKHIISGKADGTFGVNERLTRGQFAAMLTRALGLSDGTLTVEKEIELAYKNGLTSLTPAAFKAKDGITREQMAQLVMAAYKKQTGKAYTAKKHTTYKDQKKINKRFVAAIDAAYELGILTGHTNGKFQPASIATRAQAAKVISSLLEKK